MMAIKLVFDNVEDFKELFNFFSIVEGDSVNVIDQAGKEDDGLPYDVKPVISMFEEEPIMTVSPNFEKILNYGKYRYDINRCYFKTQKGKSGRILITGNEALTIIPLIEQGLSDKQIYSKMINEYNGFYHDNGTFKNTATVSTVRTFRERYEAMELNKAITFYCNNSRVNEDPLDYVKFPVLQEDDVEVEDLWH